jgi:hypothetical protein
MCKDQKPVILNVVDHHQMPLDSIEDLRVFVAEENI